MDKYFLESKFFSDFFLGFLESKFLARILEILRDSKMWVLMKRDTFETLLGLQ